MITSPISFALSDQDEAKSMSLSMNVIVRDPSGDTVTPEAAFVLSEGTTMTWDWGDGTVETGLTSIPSAHTYSSPGTYRVVVSGIIESIGSVSGFETYHNHILLPGKLYYDTNNDTSIGDVRIIDNSCGKLTQLGYIHPDQSYGTLSKSSVFQSIAVQSVELPASIRILGDETFISASSKPRSSTSSPILPPNLDTIGRFCFAYSTNYGYLSLPSTVRRLGLRCFYGSKRMSSFTFPRCLEEIHTPIFNANSKPGSFSIESGNSSFYVHNGSLLVSSVTHAALEAATGFNGSFPSDTSSIADYCCDGCTSMTSVSIPSSLKSFGNYCFNGCSGLVSFPFPDGVESIGQGCFYGCTSLSSASVSFASPQGLPDRVFQGDTSLTSFTASRLTTIGWYTFSGCTSLSSVVLPETFTGCTGRNAFLNCPLQSLVVESPTVVSFGDSPFRESYSQPVPSTLRLYVLPWLVSSYKSTSPWSMYQSQVLPYYGVTTVMLNVATADTMTLVKPTTSSGYATVDWGDGSAVETASSNLSHSYSPGTYTVTISGNVTGLSGYATGYEDAMRYPFLSNDYYTTRRITAVTKLGYGITSLGKYCFYGVTSPSVTLPGAVTSIGEFCFESARIGSLKINGPITSVPRFCFHWGTFSSIDLPSTVTSIGDSAFSSLGTATGGTVLVVRSATPPSYSGSHSDFDYFKPGTIYVPDSSVSSYKSTSPWSRVASRIHPLSEYSG